MYAKQPITKNSAQPHTTLPALNPIQSKYHPVPCAHMKPAPSIQHHPAFEILAEYATASCPVNCSPDWTYKHITTAIA